MNIYITIFIKIPHFYFKNKQYNMYREINIGKELLMQTNKTKFLNIIKIHLKNK